MQGKELENESNSGEFRNPKGALRNFRKLEGISQSLAKLKNFATPFLALRNFRNLVKSSCNLNIFLHQLR